MDFVRYTFFEKPTLLYVILSLAWLVALGWFWARRTRRAAAVLMVLPGLAVVFLVVSLAVQTRREKVLQTVAILASAVQGQDAEAAIERISPLYDNGGAKKEDLATVARWAMERFRFESVIFSGGALRFENGIATVDRWVLVMPSPGSRVPFGPQRMHWEMKLGADADGQWRVREVMCLVPIQGTPEEIYQRIR